MTILAASLATVSCISECGYNSEPLAYVLMVDSSAVILDDHSIYHGHITDSTDSAAFAAVKVSSFRPVGINREFERVDYEEACQISRVPAHHMPLDMNSKQVQVVLATDRLADTLTFEYETGARFQRAECGYIIELENLRLTDSRYFAQVYFSGHMGITSLSDRKPKQIVVLLTKK